MSGKWIEHVGRSRKGRAGPARHVTSQRGFMSDPTAKAGDDEEEIEIAKEADEILQSAATGSAAPSPR